MPPIYAPNPAKADLKKTGDSSKPQVRWTPTNAHTSIIATVMEPTPYGLVAGTKLYRGFPMVYDTAGYVPGDPPTTQARYIGWRPWYPIAAPGQKIGGILWTPEVTPSAPAGSEGAELADPEIEILIAGQGFLQDVLIDHAWLLTTGSAQSLATAFNDLLADALRGGHNRDLVFQDIPYKPVV